MSVLPTRVSRACYRCRRNKSRCDRFRPCSLCLRANAVCEETGSGGDRSHTVVTPSASAPNSSPPRKRRRHDTGVSEPASILRHGQSLPYITADSLRAEHTTTSPHSVQSIQHDGGDSAISLVRKIHSSIPQPTQEHVVDALPGANDSPTDHATHRSAPVASYLSHALPEFSVVESLLDEYFLSVHWFSLVIVESKLRTSLNLVRGGYATPSEKPFLLLLCSAIGLAAFYRAYKPNSKHNASTWLDIGRKMVANAENQIVGIMDQRSITAIQTLILLGSYYVYHGRPNLSFSLLGATIKAAQSIGLHQASVGLQQIDCEERKRVWWTIYTWDRHNSPFATVNYGRPLGISEKVCSVEQPIDLFEDPAFRESALADSERRICYSAYQRELNKVYLIASPPIERVYRTHDDEQLKTAGDYFTLVQAVTKQLWAWREDLPQHLQLDARNDWPENLSAKDEAHRLQSLSLYLTFDSLILILHRPFMKHRLHSFLADQYGEISPRDDVIDISTGSVPRDLARSDVTSHEQLWDAAVRTANITQLPQMAQLATDGHLGIFLAINLFNAAVVLIVMALSSPLTDRAQEAKRAVARIFRLHVSLIDRSVVSRQSSAILKSLIQLLISRESEAILAPPAPLTTAGSRTTAGHASENGPAPVTNHHTVRDALSMPLDALGVMGEEAGMAGEAQPYSTNGRVDISLEHVQQAFTAGAAERFGSRRGSRFHTTDVLHHQPNADQIDLQPDIFGDASIPIEWADFDMDNGMHWLWDSALDDLLPTADSL